MNNKYIFDVDGTLTPSRQQIDHDFEKYMLDFSDEEDVYLVTGSDREKTIEQIGDKLFQKAKRIEFRLPSIYFPCHWKLVQLIAFTHQINFTLSLVPFLNSNLLNTFKYFIIKE